MQYMPNEYKEHSLHALWISMFVFELFQAKVNTLHNLQEAN